MNLYADGHVASTSSAPSSANALDSARQFIPVFQKDTEELVSKIAEAGDDDAKLMRKDVVSIEEDSLMDTMVSSASVNKKSTKALNGKSKKRRHAKNLFRSDNKKEDDGLVPVVCFLLFSFNFL